MSRGETEKWMIDDEQIITIQILLDGRFAKLAQSSPVPLDFDFSMLCFVFGNACKQRGITTRVIPGEPFQIDSHCDSASRKQFLYRVKPPDASRPARCARNTGPLRRAGSALHMLPQCGPNSYASGLPAFL